MGFIRSMEELEQSAKNRFEFYGAEMLTVFFETKPETAARLLPPPLEPADLPLAMAFTANYPKTNFGVSYLESALFLQAKFKGEDGLYCLAMPVTDDMAMIGGREVFGYPKKIGRISLERAGDEFHGWTERHGVRFLDMKAKMTGSFNVKEYQELIVALLESPDNMVVFNYKYFMAPELMGFDYNPRLIREEIETNPTKIEIGEAEMVFQSSEHDPWGDVEIVRILGAVYAVGDNSMLPGSVVAEVDQLEFAPYAFMKVDSFG